MEVPYAGRRNQLTIVNTAHDLGKSVVLDSQLDLGQSNGVR